MNLVGSGNKFVVSTYKSIVGFIDVEAGFTPSKLVSCNKSEQYLRLHIDIPWEDLAISMPRKYLRCTKFLIEKSVI